MISLGWALYVVGVIVGGGILMLVACEIGERRIRDGRDPFTGERRR